MKMNSKIGIVILNYKTPNDAFKCIKSIKKQTIKSYHIYLVDNNSPDNSIELFQKWYQNDEEVTVIRSFENKGYSAGNNLGIKMALKDHMDYLCILNSDVVLLNNSIDNMYLFLKTNTAIGWVGPRIYNENGVEIEDARNKIRLKDYLFLYKPFSYISKLNNKAQANRFIKIDPTNGVFIFYGAISGCCFMVRTKLMEKCGLFDEKVFLYSEEDILAYKMEKLKYKTAILMDSKIVHKCGGSTKGDSSIFGRYHKRISSMYVIRAYEGAKGLCFNLCIILNKTMWKILSINNQEYEKYNKKFCNSLKRIQAMDAGISLKMLKS